MRKILKYTTNMPVSVTPMEMCIRDRCAEQMLLAQCYRTMEETGKILGESWKEWAERYENLIKKIQERFWDEEKHAFIDSFAVSYTHLDVYKRQEKSVESPHGSRVSKAILQPEHSGVWQKNMRMPTIFRRFRWRRGLT